MKTLPSGMQADLDSGATTHCFCWRLIRADGTVMGFTDHDEDLIFGEVTYEAHAALSASAVSQSTGLAVDSAEAAGALTSSKITESDITAGLYDDAFITVYRVDWLDPFKRVTVFAGSIGNVTRRRLAFNAEIRGIANYLNQPIGRIYATPCDAVLGDARCTIDLSASGRTVSSHVTDVSSNRVFKCSTSEMLAKPSGFFDFGYVIFTSGGNAGIKMEVKSHINNGIDVLFELWTPMPYEVLVSATLQAIVGCDLFIETCDTKFANSVNHRGFPRMPGNDRLLQIARKGSGSSNDGGSTYSGGGNFDGGGTPGTGPVPDIGPIIVIPVNGKT